ncbi:MAG: hypothetical protein ABI178_13100 [Rhodanobacter sp.]
MKSIHRVTVLGVLLACSGAAAASSGSLDEFQPKVLPVLVQVNSHGQVTNASPAIELSPNVNRLLRANLDEMINKPAHDKHGQPMSSQFVINLAVQAAPLGNGQFDARFAYVSATPVPAGSWYWVHIDGHRLALARQDSRYRQPSMHDQYDRDRLFHQRSYERTPTPARVNATQSSPTPQLVRGPAEGK